MKIEKNIFIAFILNFAFSIFELIGGFVTGSIAIISDAVHDAGDSLSIGLSFFLEKKSKKKPDEKYTYGYARFSVLGSIITSLILLLGSTSVIITSVGRIIEPRDVNYDGMIVFAVIGVCVNFCAALFTHGNTSLNQKAINLHMLEDVLGWLAVLVCAVIMRFTNLHIIDPLISCGISIFILINAISNLKNAFEIFLEKTPNGTNAKEIKDHLMKIEGVLDVHHIHVRSIDGQSNDATMHIITDYDNQTIKALVRQELSEHNISHSTLELESSNESCRSMHCSMHFSPPSCHHHNH